MRGSNASQKISVAKRDRRRFRLENENVGEKNVVLRKIEKVVVVSGSRGLQKTEHYSSALRCRPNIEVV